MTFLLIAIGLVLLLVGGEVLVRGGVGLAGRLRVSPAIVGVTVLGFGTSMPELVTSLQAAARGAPGIALGNVLGSNIANILLILGLAVVVAPVATRGAVPVRDQWMLVLATLIALALTLFGAVGRGPGLAMMAALAAFLWLSVRAARAEHSDMPAALISPPPLWQAGALAVGGIAITILGAHLLVDASVTLARAWGISETVIGLTLVAVGTSLPELATTLVAAIRGQGQLALGNVVGSNIFNILGILGITGVIFPFAVPDAIGWVDVALVGSSAVAMVALLQLAQIGRIVGSAMLATYLGYCTWLAMTA